MQFSIFTIISFFFLFLKKNYIHVYANTDAEKDNVENDNEHRYMIKFKQKHSFQRETYKLQIDGDQRLIMTLPDDNVDVLSLNTTEEVISWEGHDDVEYVEHDTKVYLQQQLELVPWGIQKVKALDVNDDNISNQKVCIIDTGYDISHPDLPSSTNIVSGISQSSNELWSEDGDGHGTHVAGTIAAIGENNLGVVGVSRHGQLKLHIVKIFDNDGKWTWKSDLIKAVEDCVSAGSTIINMSLGGPNYSQTENALYEKLYNEQNIILVAAAGNSGTNAKIYPASYPSVISVGAVDRYNVRGYFSQYNDQIDIVAPGVSIQSTFKGGSYRIFDGTSMASPHVAGVAALVWSHFPTISAKELRDVLESTAQDLGEAGRDDEYGNGLIRADLAYTYLGGGNDKGCKDTPDGWHDSDGPVFNCKWYAETNRCVDYGNKYENRGKTAQGACCACGGGIVHIAIAPSSSPTIASVPQTSSPTIASVPQTSSPTVASVSPTSSPTVAPVSPTSSPSDASVSVSDPPTSSPTTIVSSPPTSPPNTTCQDSPADWHDSDGSVFNCKWYAEGDRCQVFGTIDGSLGKTAQEACCVCGGGLGNFAIPPGPVASTPPTVPVPQTSSPTTTNISTRCGCDTCTSSIRNQILSGSGMSLNQQLDWLISFFSYNEEEACTKLCGDLFAGDCDECNPQVCNR